MFTEYILHKWNLNGYRQTRDLPIAAANAIRKLADPQNPLWNSVVAIDTETTSLDAHHPYNPAMPFVVTARTQNERYIWKLPFNPFSSHDKTPWQSLTPKSKRVFKNIVHEITNFIAQFNHLVFHNALHDIPCLHNLGVDINFGNATIHDTLAASHVCDSYESHALKDLAFKYFDMTDWDESALKADVATANELFSQKINDHGLTLHESLKLTKYSYWTPFLATILFPREAERLGLTDENLSEYALRDTDRTWQLFAMYTAVMESQGLTRNYIREIELLPVWNLMNAGGVPLHSTNLQTEYESYADSLAENLNRIVNAARFLNPARNYNDRILGSQKQLNALLFHDLGLTPLKESPASKSDNPTYSTDAETLEHLIHTYADDPVYSQENPAVCKLLHRIANARRFKTGYTYVKSYIDRAVKGYTSEREDAEPIYAVFPSNNPWATNTTRISTTNPSVQNVGVQKDPDDTKLPLRRVFGPPPGWVWWCIDADQLELRLMARASGDPALAAVLNDGADRHQMTCDAINEVRSANNLDPISRKQAKNINFAWQYGAGLGKLSRMAGIPAAEFDVAMRTAYPGVVEFMDDTISFSRRHGYVFTLYGYRLTTPKLKAYAGTNYVIQGSAGDFIKNSMLAVHRFLTSNNLNDTIRLLIQVHDELVFASRDDIDPLIVSTIAQIMEEGGNPINCKLPVNIARCDDNWNDEQDVNLPRPDVHNLGTHRIYRRPFTLPFESTN